MNKKYSAAQVDLKICPEPDRMATGISWLDGELEGGFVKGTFCEISSPGGVSTGGSVLLLRLLRNAAMNRKRLVLIDAADSFDPCSAGTVLCKSMLWARCRSVEESLRVADLVLRDANLPLVVFDLQLCSAEELRKVPSSSWYRLRGVIEGAGVVCVALTPFAVIRGAGERFELTSKFCVGDCECPESGWESKFQGRRREVSVFETEKEASADERATNSSKSGFR